METIKKIKIERVNPENGHHFVTYVDKKEKTKYVNYINDHTSSKIIKTTEVEMKSHHTAIARKYVGVNSEWNEYYNGRFGEGYIIHHPTLRYGKGYMFRGNNFHVIEYVVEC